MRLIHDSANEKDGVRCVLDDGVLNVSLSEKRMRLATLEALNELAELMTEWYLLFSFSSPQFNSFHFSSIQFNPSTFWGPVCEN